jgi:hypothetical protein
MLARVRAFAARTTPEQVTAVAALEDGSLVAVRKSVSVNAFSGERAETSVRLTLPGSEELAQLLLDPDQKMIYGASARGHLFAWELRSDGIRSPDVADAGSPVTALALLRRPQPGQGSPDGALGRFRSPRAARAPSSCARTSTPRARRLPVRGRASRRSSRSARTARRALSHLGRVLWWAAPV